jgi:hypothetical protein
MSNDVGIEKCKAINNALERLACYDSLFNRVNTESDKSGVAELTRPNLEADFGAEQLARSEHNKEIQEISVQVVDIQENNRGQRTFILANGQHWRETELSRLRVKTGQEVVVKKGAFSAYYLKKPNVGRTVRVKRIN